jgi:hypothetical protein
MSCERRALVALAGRPEALLINAPVGAAVGIAAPLGDCEDRNNIRR